LHALALSSISANLLQKCLYNFQNETSAELLLLASTVLLIPLDVSHSDIFYLISHILYKVLQLSAILAIRERPFQSFHMAETLSEIFNQIFLIAQAFKNDLTDLVNELESELLEVLELAKLRLLILVVLENLLVVVDSVFALDLSQV
jgi:hypothetical protein